MSTYLVTGATGHQGGSVVTTLLAAGAKVHAIVRDPSSAKAKALQEKGVVLFQGTHEEPDEVFRAAAVGCSGLFLNPSIFEPGKAKAQAEGIINACKAGAGPTLTTVVLSSTSRTDEMAKDLSIAESIHPWLGQYYTAKSEVEAAVKESGVQHNAILRPPVLAYDYLLPSSATPFTFAELPRSGTLETSLDENNTMAYLDETDIGKVASAILLDPAKYSGHAFELAGDVLTARQVRDILAKVSGVDVKLHKRTPEEMDATASTAFFQMFEKLANLRPHTVDLKALEEKYGFKLNSLEEYLVRNREALLDSLPPRSAKFFEKA